MSRWSIYRLHKWFAVSGGMFLLIWLITGVVILLPPLSAGPKPVRWVPNVDFRDITLSPAQAVLNLEKALRTSVQVNAVNLKRIHDVVVYEIRLKNSGTHLINAASGQMFSITRDLARRYVRESYPNEGRVLKVETVERHGYAYQWGALPAYRVVLESEPSVDFFVATRDGTVRRSDRVNRVRAALGSLHTFDPLKLLIRSDKLRRGLMIVAGVIGIVAALTGYYLSLRRS